MPGKRKVLLFDIDNTLIVIKDLADALPLPKEHLVHVLICDQDYYFINLAQMKKLIPALMAAGIEIGWITTGTHLPSIKAEFAKLLELDNHIFDDCIFISKNEYGTPFTLKGKKIAKAKDSGLFGYDDVEIWLVDNNELSIEDAKAHGFNTIQAGGYPEDNSKVRQMADLGYPIPTCVNLGSLKIDNSYIEDMISIFGLKLELIPAEESLKKPRLGLGI